MAETPQEHNARMYRLADLSPRVRQILETGSYHMSFQVEEVDNETIRQEMFIGLVEDLSDLGIYFTCPNETIYAENILILDQVMDVLDWIMPGKLYPKLRMYPELVAGITQVLEGVDDDPIIRSYLSYLGGSEQVSGIRPNMVYATTFFKEHTRITEVFVQYLETLLGLFKAERVSATALLTSPQEWLAFHDTIIERSTVAFSTLVGQDLISEEDERKMRVRLKTHLINALVSPDQHELMSYLYLSDPSTMSDDAKTFFDKKWTEYKTGSKFFGNYFKARELPITTFDVLGFVLYDYAITSTAVAFQTLLEKIKDDYPTHNETLLRWETVLLSEKEREHHEH